MSSESNAYALPSEPHAAAAPAAPQGVELAASVAAKICHDLISPISAIVSGLDLLEDEQSQDMREDAMNLIAQSAKKLAAQLSFARVAFGASAAADTFDARELEKLTRGVFETVRAELDWAVAAEALPKAAARALLNVAQIGATALPTGGVAKVTAAEKDGQFLIGLEARGPRARLRAETAEGLKGLPLSDGLPGQWIQAYYLHGLVTAAGGQVFAAAEEEHVAVQVTLPL
jgi:histidine phosphotransferase ChpT